MVSDIRKFWKITLDWVCVFFIAYTPVGLSLHPRWISWNFDINYNFHWNLRGNILKGYTRPIRRGNTQHLHNLDALIILVGVHRWVSVRGSVREWVYLSIYDYYICIISNRQPLHNTKKPLIIKRLYYLALYRLLLYVIKLRNTIIRI